MFGEWNACKASLVIPRASRARGLLVTYAGWHSESQHSESQHSESQHSESQHPESQHSESQHPESQHPESQHPRFQRAEFQCPESRQVIPTPLEIIWLFWSL